MKFRIQVERIITLREEIEVECASEDILDGALDEIENDNYEDMDCLMNDLDKFSEIEVTKYIEDGSGNIEISIENIYKI